MQVNVLVRDGVDDQRTPLLVLPFGEAGTLPISLRTMRWRELATATTDDRLLRSKRLRIEAEIACRGYSLIGAS